jgi:hypothetical protein
MSKKLNLNPNKTLKLTNVLFTEINPEEVGMESEGMI